MAINDFIKGGQTFSQNWRMFTDIFWKVVSAFFLIWALSFSGLMYVKTTKIQRYQAFTLLKAEPFSLLFRSVKNSLDHIGLMVHEDPEKSMPITYQTPGGQKQRMTFDAAVKRIATPQFIEQLEYLLFWSAIESFLTACVLTLIITKLLIVYGQMLSKKKLLRGTSICKAEELTQCIKKRYKKHEAPELAIADIPLPKNAEKQHIWINGTTGAGKTVAFSELLTQIRQKNRRAVVYDIMGTYVARFYRPGKDIILNPFDTRFPGWNPWVECHNSVDYEMLAASQIPIAAGTAEDPFWKKAARSLYSATLRRLGNEGQARNMVLLRYLLTSDMNKLRELLKNTEADALVSESLEKTALSVKAILNDYIKGLRFLHDDGELFSIRHWVRHQQEDSWIFITSRPDHHETLMPLISTWYDTAVTEALSLPHNEQRRIYFALDELPTLQYLPALKRGITLGRQKGLCFILGTQDLSQLRVNYGADNANTLIGNANTKLILRTGNDAENISRLFNQSEYEEHTESLSYGVTDNRDGVSISKQHHTQHVILGSELQSLHDLEGYLRVPGNYPIAKIQLDYVKYDEPNERLIPREHDIDWLIVPESETTSVKDRELSDELEKDNTFSYRRVKTSKSAGGKQILKNASYENNANIIQEIENANVPVHEDLEDDYRF